MTKFKIGELMVEDGLISKEQLKEVLEVQKKTGKKLASLWWTCS